MFMSEKTDRVIWQVTDTTGVPILGRTQAKLMNYLSYPEIHPPHGQSPVSKDCKPQSTVYKDCAVYEQSQDCTQSQPDCPGRA